MVSRSNLYFYGLLWLLGLYLRLAILIVPPLIPRLESVFGFSAGEVALATSLPSLLIGAGALFGAWMIARLGIIRTILLGLLVMAAGSALRSLPAGYPLFLWSSAALGCGIAMMQIGMPVLARTWLPFHIGRAAAVYTNGLLCGELLAAGLTGPLVTHVLQEQWSLAFLLWVLPTPLIAVALFRARHLTPALPMPPPAAGTAATVSWFDPQLWRVALMLGAAGSSYFSGNIFLPAILSGSDRLSLLAPGLAALNASQLISSGVLMIYADRLLGRRWPMCGALSLSLISILSMLYLPGWGVLVGATLLGFSVSSLLTFSMALPAWLVPLHKVSRMAAGVLFIGHILIFLIPTLGGWAMDISGGNILMSFLPTIALLLLAIATTGTLQGHTAAPKAPQPQSDPTLSRR